MRVRAILPMSSVASSGIGLFAVAWLAIYRLSPSELGFFFSFLSFGALVQLADFGLSYATLVTAGRMTGTGQGNEIPALGGFVARWNMLASCGSVVVVGTIGVATFRGAAPTPGAPPVMWGGPWLAFLLGVLAAQWGVPGISLREGGGKVTPMWRLRLVLETAGALACFVALYLGAGLWSLAAYSFTRALVIGTWLRIVDPLRQVPGVPRFSIGRWMKKSWPFQWKIGLSALSGFLIFRAFSPIILYVQGPVPAGQFGLSVAMMNLLIAITGAWPMSQTARYTSLLAERRFREFDAELPVILLRSTALSIAGTSTLLLLLWLARGRGLVFAERLTDPATTAVILSCAVVHHVANCIAVFLRAEGRDPLVIPSVLGGVATVGVVWLTARTGTLFGVATAYLALASLGIPIAALIYRARARGRRRLELIGPREG
jgi:hypothetical protein